MLFVVRRCEGGAIVEGWISFPTFDARISLDAFDRLVERYVDAVDAIGVVRSVREGTVKGIGGSNPFDDSNIRHGDSCGHDEPDHQHNQSDRGEEADSFFHVVLCLYAFRRLLDTSFSVVG